MEKIESISILWSKRKENVDVLSKKLFYSLEYISKEFPEIYSNWYQKGKSLSEALKNKVAISTDNLKKILEVNVDKEFPNLGIRISLWNGIEEDDKQASFSATLGLYTDSENLKNSFVLDFPEQNCFKMEDLKPLITFIYSTFQGESLRINGIPCQIQSSDCDEREA
ncbi:MAG: hypothetical protein LBJ88_01145 [Campylobacteraceae bacterium]|jgi:hypothetical protein|nr:hypothetical protein [Campylobacteraceae bacterium]